MNDEKAIYQVLAHSIAQQRVDDEVVRKVANALAKVDIPLRRIDVCTYGICLDYLIDHEKWWEVLPELVEVGKGRVGRVEVFPLGIPFPDIFHVRIEHDLDAIARG